MRQHDESGNTTGVAPKGAGTKFNALWGKGRRRNVLLLGALLTAAIAVGTVTARGEAAPRKGFVLKSFLDRANDNPNAVFDVIIQSTDSSNAGDLGAVIDKFRAKHGGKARGLRKKFKSLPAVTAEITGDAVEDIAGADGVLSVTEDAPIQPTGYGNSQGWPDEVDVQWGVMPRRADVPTIAIVDSGVESRGDFGMRLVKQVDLTSSGFNSRGDGFGHGTLVAGLAAGGNDRYAGAEPRANIVSLDVLDDAGAGRVSDVIDACDWILQNKDRLDIRVANFSINAAGGGGAGVDPLDRAVERLWLNGVVVVAAAGNYAVSGAESGVGFAPANDPFVITVGAADPGATSSPGDDFAAPWSAWGSTQDGFLKPEVAAPGRVLNGPVPKRSLMYQANPARRVDDGYMWMSGTSFAAPIVAGGAATILSRHPDWTPDQVKGALMSSANLPRAATSLGALGTGIIDIGAAIASSGQANPNTGLNRFVVTDRATGLRTFDATDWSAAAASNPTWNQASWSSASWSSASWSSASWSSASWSSASWSSASWASMFNSE